MNQRQPCQIYLLTPPEITNMEAFLAKLSSALEAAPVGSVQIRLKQADDLAIIHAADVIVPICHAKGVSVIINDRPDLVEACGADGVHIGQADMDYFSSRELLGADAIIGVTCHNSKDLAFEAANAGADYVAFGAFFDTPTKKPESRADMEIVKWWNKTVEIPCVAIGGITPCNAKPIIEAGADFIALSSGVWDFAQGPAAATEKLHQLCLQYSPSQ